MIKTRQKHFVLFIMFALAVMMSGCITYTPRTWVETNFPTAADCKLGIEYLAAEHRRTGEIINSPRCKKQKDKGNYLGSYSYRLVVFPIGEWDWLTPKIEKRVFKHSLPTPDPAVVREYFERLDPQEPTD